MKSLSELDRLINDVILASDFRPEDLRGFCASQEAGRLDNQQIDSCSQFPATDDWIELTVEIALPCNKVQHKSGAEASCFTISGLFYRPLLQVIKMAFQDTTAEYFHFSPFREYWKPSPDAPPEWIYSELYASEAYIKEHERIISQLPEPGCTLERVIAGIMLWSDSMHLASFSNASLWPIYLYIGNLSKYICLGWLFNQPYNGDESPFTDDEH